MSFARPEVGDIIEVFGCSWDEGWEFDKPSVIYAPFKVYSCTDRSIDGMLEDIFIDFAVDSDGDQKVKLPIRWSENDLEEFAWRGWNPGGFARRKNAWHTKMTIRIIRDEDGLGYVEVEKEVSQRGPFAKTKKAA